MTSDQPKRTAMGSRAAYREAVRRWGHSAIVLVLGGEMRVGVFIPHRPTWWNFWRKPALALDIRGYGKTWAAAFRDADRREGK